jgi:surfactin synthase thioesterase subunit
VSNAAWWLPAQRDWRADAVRRLLVLPYAGGGATAFKPWLQALHSDVQMAAVQLPGREARFTEPPLANWSALLDALTSAVSGLPDDGLPVVLFGHSAGALIAFELAKRLAHDGRAPAALLVSACRAPHRPPRREPLSKASDAALTAAIRRLGGTPSAALDNPELLALLLPVLRSDCVLFDTYASGPVTPLDVPIIVFHGSQDRLVDGDEARAWAAHTKKAFGLHTIDAGHFYLHDPAFMRLMNEALIEAPLASRPNGISSSTPKDGFHDLDQREPIT